MINLRSKFTTEERFVPKQTREHLYVTSYLLMAFGAVLFIALMLQVINHVGIVAWDSAVQQWSLTIRSASLTAFNAFLAIIFGPNTLPFIILAVFVVWFIAAKHAWRPLLFAGGMAFGSTMFLIIENIIRRPRPPADMSATGHITGFSFPSGHVTAASDLFILISYLILSRKVTPLRLTLAIVISIIGISSQIFGRIYLGDHWLSDTLAALCLATFVLGLVMYIDTRRTVRISGEKVTGKFSKPQTDNT